MAKNKNRDRNKAASGRGQRQDVPAGDAQEMPSGPEDSAPSGARKKEKRFGHG